jgi:hypothetical protein
MGEGRLDWIGGGEGRQIVQANRRFTDLSRAWKESAEQRAACAGRQCAHIGPAGSAGVQQVQKKCASFFAAPPWRGHGSKKYVSTRAGSQPGAEPKKGSAAPSEEPAPADAEAAGERRRRTTGGGCA